MESATDRRVRARGLQVEKCARAGARAAGGRVKYRDPACAPLISDQVLKWKLQVLWLGPRFSTPWWLGALRCRFPAGNQLLSFP